MPAPRTHPHHDGDFREARKWFQYDGTDWKQLKKAFRHDGTKWRQVFGGGFWSQITGIANPYVVAEFNGALVVGCTDGVFISIDGVWTRLGSITYLCYSLVQWGSYLVASFYDTSVNSYVTCSWDGSLWDELCDSPGYSWWESHYQGAGIYYEEQHGHMSYKELNVIGSKLYCGHAFWTGSTWRTEDHSGYYSLNPNYVSFPYSENYFGVIDDKICVIALDATTYTYVLYQLNGITWTPLFTNQDMYSIFAGIKASIAGLPAIDYGIVYAGFFDDEYQILAGYRGIWSFVDTAWESIGGIDPSYDPESELPFTYPVGYQGRNQKMVVIGGTLYFIYYGSVYNGVHPGQLWQWVGDIP